MRKKFQTRRKHSNSKHGCLQCKKRRIKCGQELPQCKHCTNYRAKNLRCLYMDLTDEERAAVEEANRRSERNSPHNVEGQLSFEDPIRGIHDMTIGGTFGLGPGSPLPYATYCSASFALNKVYPLGQNTDAIQKVLLFILDNILQMRVIDGGHTVYFRFVADLWVSTTIEDAGQQLNANFYALIAWASAYIAECSHKTQPKHVQHIALRNSGILLLHLTAAIQHLDYRQLLDFLALNMFVANSDYTSSGLLLRYTHLSGLVAIIFELYLHARQGMYYIPGYEPVYKLRFQPQRSPPVQRPIGTGKPMGPGFARFSDVAPHELILIKFFEWQIFLLAISVFFPIYDHRCLFEFHRNIENFKHLLLKLQCTSLAVRTDTLLKFIDYLFKDVFPEIEAGNHDTEVFHLHPKVLYEIYTRFHKIAPPEMLLALLKKSSLLLAERILYRYYFSLSKILDSVFPEARYMFMTGFLTAHYQYADEVEVFDDVKKVLPEGVNCVVDEISERSLRYHIDYCSRVFSFFRTRGLFLHQGLVVTDPYPEAVRKDPFLSRRLEVHETQILSFDSTFVRPENYPHTNSTPSHLEEPLRHLQGFSFKGQTLDELTRLDRNVNDGRGCFMSPKQMLMTDDFEKQQGMILGYDYCANFADLPVSVRHWVGRTLRDLYEDRSAIYNYYNN